MSALCDGAQEASLIIFDYIGEEFLVEPMLRRLGLLVEDRGCVIKRGTMGVPRISQEMIAYITPNQDGNQRIHVDLNVAPDLVELLSCRDDFELQPGESIIEDNDTSDEDPTESSLDETVMGDDPGPLDLEDQRAPPVRESWDDHPDNEDTVPELDWVIKKED